MLDPDPYQINTDPEHRPMYYRSGENLMLFLQKRLVVGQETVPLLFGLLHVVVLRLLAPLQQLQLLLQTAKNRLIWKRQIQLLQGLWLEVIVGLFIRSDKQWFKSGMFIQESGFFPYPAVFRIHDILGSIRIRILRSMLLTNGSGSWIRILLFSSLTFKMAAKN